MILNANPDDCEDEMIFSKSKVKETLRLRLWFLLPLAGVMLVAVLLMVLVIHRHVVEDIPRDTENAANLAEHLYQEEINNSASMLGATMEVLTTDKGLRQALARRDRTQLLQRSAPLFTELKKKYAITHFYFSDSNRVNILRVHQPARFGDTINRETTLQAQRSKQTSYGVELGPLGTFTLRLVTPWFAADGQLLGFVELGMEIDHVLRTVQHVGNARIFVVINKKFLDRKAWEAGMRIMGRLPDWEQFPDVVVNNQAIEDIPKDLTRGLQESLLNGRKFEEYVVAGTSAYRAVFLPLKDAAGNSVGRMVVLLDVSAQLKGINAVTRDSIFVGGIAGATLLGFFYWLLGILGKRMERDQQLLRYLNEGLETKVQERTKQLLEVQDDLVRKEKLAVLGQVAGSVGHELRNPLGVMSNAVYFLQTVLADADKTTKEYLDIIKDEIACSERIVSDLLDSVRTQPPQIQTVGIAELIEQTLHKYTVASPVTIKLDIPATLPPLRVDAMQIQQVFRNLISNGVEAMPEGGTLEISAFENKQDGTVTVSVCDSGVGMTPAQLAKLFQPLYTTKARGIGLGLVVVKNLTQANGGKVEVQSEPGKGTTFAVILPA
jgi:signal transduction histidine kinase